MDQYLNTVGNSDKGRKCRTGKGQKKRDHSTGRPNPNTTGKFVSLIGVYSNILSTKI